MNELAERLGKKETGRCIICWEERSQIVDVVGRKAALKHRREAHPWFHEYMEQVKKAVGAR